MALIECADCGNRISDAAQSCPQCGAPVPQTIGEDQIQCPHCMNVIDGRASTCANCGAIKGYVFDRRYGALGKISTVIWGVIFPLGVTLVLPILGLLMVPLALFAAYRLLTGPRWYQIR